MTDPSSSSSRMLAMLVRAGALLLAFAAGAWLFGAPAARPDVHAEHEDAAVYTCSMHPQVRRGEPGACPICGMALIPATAANADATTPDRVVLSDRARALARLRTATVSRRSDATDQVRLLGLIEPDESTRRNVTTWIGGRIDDLVVNTTGERVRKGQVIATLYSPEVYSAHQDLLAAKAQVARLMGSPEAARLASASAFEAARERLRLLGVPADELARMEEADTPTQAIAVRSPFSGTVIERVATEGAYVSTGAALYRLADLSTLWVQLDAYETDLPRLAVGESVSLTVEALPGETFEGRVAFIDPTVNPQSRTARVRVQVDNADGRLRPGLFAEAVVAGRAAEGSDAPLVIPASAPLFTGRRSLVYVEVTDADGVAYEPRTVRLGPRLGDTYPVVAGLSAGDRVVVAGAFALDADLQIQGGASMMSPDERPGAEPWSDVVPMSAAERAELAPVVHAYLDVQRALAEDDHATTVTAAQALSDSLAEVDLEGPAGTAWAPLHSALAAHAQHIADALQLEGARASFEPLSASVETLLRRFGNPLSSPLSVAYCPMAMGSEGARWVQQGDTIDNAYFGASMRACGEIRDTVEPGAFLPVSEPAP